MCVFSQMKDIKQIRLIFIPSPGSCPRGGTWGGGGQGVHFFPKFNQLWCVSYSHKWHVQRHNLFGHRPLWPWEGPKGQISLNYIVNFKYFLHQNLFVFSQMKYIKHIRRDFYSVAWVMPQGWDTRCWGTKIKFSEHSHVAIQIKKGWSVDQDTLKSFTLESNWWPLGGSKGQIPFDFFKSVGICDGAPSNVF